MASTFGPIVGQIKADTSDFNKKMGDAAKKAETFAQRAGKGIKGIGKAIASAKGAFAAFAAVLAVRGTFNAITGAIEKLDKLGDTANKIGFTTDALQELRFAASQVNVEQTALDTGLQRFARRLGEARQGTGELKDALKQNGIELNNADGSIKSTEKVLNEFADAIKNAGDDAEQLRLATKGFDTEGAALVNIFKGGAQAMADFALEARAAGLVINEDIIANAGEAGDALSKMQQVLDTQLTIALAQAAPAITSVGAAFTEALPGMISFLEELFVATENQSIPTLQKQMDELTESIERQEAIIEKKKNKKVDFSFAPGTGIEEAVLRNKEKELALLREIRDTKILDNERAKVAAAERRKEIEEQVQARIKAAKEVAQAEADIAQAERERDKAARDVANKKKKDAEEEIRVADAKVAALAKEREAWIKLGDPMIQIREDLIAISQLIQSEENPEAIRALEEAWLRVAERTSETKDEQDKSKEKTDEFTKSLEQMGATFESAFESAVLGGGNLSDIFNGLIKDILRMTIRALILQPILDALGKSSAFGGIFGKIFGGSAGGGSLQAGQAELVGERGPEIIVPSSPARVLNNHSLNQMGGGGRSGGGTKIEIINRGTPQQAIGSTSTQSASGAITQIFLDDIKLDGPMSTSMSSAFNLRRGR